MLTGTAPPRAQAPQTSEGKIPLDVREVAAGVLFLRPDAPIGNPTTIAILGDCETVLLDASIPEVAPLIDRYLKERGARPVGRVITTHAHRDHTDGLVYWTDRGATAVATLKQKNEMANSPVIAGALSAGTDPRPTVVVDDSLVTEIMVGGKSLPVYVLRPPNRSGHTNGDLLIHLPTIDVLYAGDYYFFSRYPIIDTEGGGSVVGYLANLDWIANSFPAETIILPGHNAFAPEPIALPDVAAFREWKGLITSSVETIHKAKTSGKTLDDAVAEGLPVKFTFLGEKPRYLSEKRWIEALWE